MGRPGQRFQVLTSQQGDETLAAIWHDAALRGVGGDVSRAANLIDVELARDPHQGWMIGDEDWVIKVPPLVAYYELLEADLRVLIHRFERTGP